MGDFIFQGILGYILINPTGSEMKPVYKLYNPTTQSYLITSDYNEAISNSDGSNSIITPTPMIDKIIVFSELPSGILKKENNDIIGVDEESSSSDDETTSDKESSVDGDSVSSIKSVQHIPYINIKIKDKLIAAS